MSLAEQPQKGWGEPNAKKYLKIKIIRGGNEQTFKACVSAAVTWWDLKERAWHSVDDPLALVSLFSLNSAGGGCFLAAPLSEMGKTLPLGVAALPRLFSLWG